MKRLQPFGVSILLLIFFIGSCVTPYQPDVQSLPKALVVEGLITDQPGPYTVKLTLTADYTYSGLNLLVSRATVTLSDNAGNTEVLQEITDGVYRTAISGMQGVVGRKYKITIKTADGKVYESETELLKSAPPIQKLYYNFQYLPNALTNNQRNTWNVYLDTKDPETTGDYYRWQWRNYEYTEACQINPVANPDGTYTGAPCCSACWNINQCLSNCIKISSDAAINGKAITGQYIMTVPYNSSGSYYLEVEQQSISEGAYRFFNSVDKLINNTGGLFDAAPQTVGGNIRCVSNPDEVVYGYFGAAGSSVMSIRIDRSKDAIGLPIGQIVQIPYTGCVACQESLTRTAKKPRWWDL